MNVGEGRLKRRRKRPHRVHLGERGIYIFESRHSPEFKMELVAQDFHHLYVVREGRGFMHAGRSDPQPRSQYPADVAHPQPLHDRTRARVVDLR